MTTLKDVVGFRRDLYFGGAVQIDWFETDEQKRDRAASNFVFHGPEYFGVTEEDKEGAKAYSLIDTVSLTSELLDSLEPGATDAFPIALAIAGYGAGKSHYALTLGRLLSAPSEVASGVILDNIESASPKLGRKIRRQVEKWDRPLLVLPINGMNDFNLAEELSRQVLVQLRANGLDTTPIEELWPRFQEAEEFVRRNFDRWETEFRKVFGKDVSQEDILAKLGSHSEAWFQKVNEIYEDATGRPIRVSGAESANQLISTLSREYCGESGPFQGVLILFDEFGRYLEFAIERPHVAGDAALQQIFEGVQDNAENCFMLCTIQYELKAYISRVSSEKQNVIQRYVGRYDAAKKYYLSSNLETLFAHLIEKKTPEFIQDHLFSEQLEKQWKSIHASISNWFPATQKESVWREKEPFFQTIVEGCWPLHPMTTLFLANLDLGSTGGSTGKDPRTSVAFIDNLIHRESGRNTGQVKPGWSLPATALFQAEKGFKDPLLEELLSGESSGGGVASSYSAVEEKRQNDLSDNERAALQAILIADKMGLKAGGRESYHQALTLLSGLSSKAIQTAVEELEKEYGVLEWSDRFVRYEVISEGIPRSRFTTFLTRKVRGVDPQKIEEFFALYLWKWADLASYREIDPEFASQHAIRTSEWRYKGILTNRDRLDQDLSQAVKDWETAVEPDSPRGQLLYCYVSADANIEEVQHRISKKLAAALPRPEVPIAVVLLHDKENRMRGILAEQWVLKDGLTKEEKGTYQNFIEDQQYRLQSELQAEFLASLKEKNFVLPQSFSGKSGTIENVCLGLFEETYPKIVGFPFDGFHTLRGGAVKDCRQITVELFKGGLDHEWLTTRPPQLQNRTKAVLIQEWEAIDHDSGRIAWYPKNEVLEQLTAEFEKELKQKESLNLGAIAKRLIAPPFGMNTASAGLFLGVFFAPRIGSMAITQNGENISWSNWLKAALPRNLFDLKILEKTDVEQVDTNEWEQLLERWEAATEHNRRAAFLDEAADLARRTPLSSDVLMEKAKNLREKAQASQKAIKDFDSFIDSKLKSLHFATEKENIETISFIGRDASKRLKQMESEVGAWTEDQIDDVDRLLKSAEVAIARKFDEWLKNQSCISYPKVPDFRDLLIKRVGGNLKQLGMNDLARQAEEKALKVIANMEERQKVFYSVQEAENFLVGKVISERTKKSDLRDWIDGCKRHENNLETARRIIDVPEIDRTIEKIQNFRADCGRQRALHQDRMDAFFGRKFQSIQDIQEAREEVRTLMEIFTGSSFEIEELETMQKRLEAVERDFAALDDLSKPDSEIRAIFDERMETARAWEEEDEQDWPQIYENMFHHVIKKREDLSKDWLDGVLTSPKEIAGMNAEKCQRLQSRLEAAPIYLTEADRKNIDEMKTAIQKRFEDLKVEGLLAQFRRLPQNLRREFFEIISAEVG